MSTAVQKVNLAGVTGGRTRRRPELDALRGLMLVWMTLTHLPTVASALTNQTLGFVSSAEGFIFLSALFTGSVYYRLARREGYGAMFSRLWKRTLRLYLYHLVLISFAFLVAGRFASPDRRPALYNLLDFYFAAGPRRAFIDAALLIYRPPLLDILPLYILFLALTMVVLFLARRLAWKWILCGGFVVWLLAQFGLRLAAYNFLHRFCGLQVPFSDLGAFDLWGWQLVWLVGLWCGVRWAEGRLPLEVWAKKLVVPAMFIAPVLLALRWAVGNGIELGNLEVMFDKWHFGAVRIVNFAALAALAIRFQRVLMPLAIRPLVAMGQASIQVFCAHLLFCFLGLAIVGTRTIASAWEQVVLVVVTLSALRIVAGISSRKKAHAAG